MEKNALPLAKEEIKKSQEILKKEIATYTNEPPDDPRVAQHEQQQFLTEKNNLMHFIVKAIIPRDANNNSYVYMNSLIDGDFRRMLPQHGLMFARDVVNNTTEILTSMLALPLEEVANGLKPSKERIFTLACLSDIMIAASKALQ